MATKLKPPPIVRQGSALICWAAACSSWAEATFQEKIPKESLVQVFQKLGLADPKGRLEVRGIFKLAELLHLQADPPLASRGLHINVPLGLSILEPKLKYSHVLVDYRGSGMSLSHWIVVYGVDQSKIYFMDPLQTRLQAIPIDQFLVDRFIAFWLKANTYERTLWHDYRNEAFWLSQQDTNQPGRRQVAVSYETGFGRTIGRKRGPQGLG